MGGPISKQQQSPVPASQEPGFFFSFLLAVARIFSRKGAESQSELPHNLCVFAPLREHEPLYFGMGMI
jgi:hypothetical protein